MIHLNRLMIHYSEYQKTYSGKIEFAGECGEIALPVDDAFARELFKLCAEQIVKTSKELAANMTANIIEQKETMKIEAQND